MKERREFRATMIDNACLLKRLVGELRFLSNQMRQTWPTFKSDPFGFGKCVLVGNGLRLRRALAAPNSIAAIATALLVVITGALVLVLIDHMPKQDRAQLAELKQVAALTFPPLKALSRDRKVGTGKGGRVGFARGRGEGSAEQHKRATGGGSGGQRDPLPAQVGKVPPPSDIPAPIPKFPPAQKQSLPVAGIDIDPALWKNQPLAVYGDPRSKSSAPSNGPGDGGGMGTVSGSGIGEGLGSGFGLGQDGNIGGGRKGIGSGGIGGGRGSGDGGSDYIYPSRQVTERARVLTKPEPQYTEEARKNGITGSVVLRVVFSRTGEVTNIRALHALPFGLTERAIMAARLIRFRPATKDGLPVNVAMQLEYNFNLY